MKVVILYLAFLILIFSFIPFAFVSCNKGGDINSKTTITLYDKENGKISDINLEEYIIGVVSAEMPAEFSAEALKSQAVAARTYALRKINKELPEHKGADLCSDFAHCQAYSDTKKLRDLWKKHYKKYSKKIKNAVVDTQGEYLEYDGEFAITVFHSCSNGITEKASDVWGGDIPYLKCVESKGDYLKKDYKTLLDFQKNKFVSRLEDFLKTNIDTSLKPIDNIKYTEGGNVEEITLFGNNIKGTDIRSIFSLKSSAFDLKVTDNIFTFTVYGNGHGVGMSQYGAEKMASDGISYNKILEHYYPGTKLKNLNN